MAAVDRLRPRLGEAFRIFSANTRRFLGVTTIVAVITGVADTLLLLWLDIPLAILWGLLLAAICNYIPYVGFVIVVVAFIVLNSLFTSLIQPYFVGTPWGSRQRGHPARRRRVRPRRTWPHRVRLLTTASQGARYPR